MPASPTMRSAFGQRVPDYSTATRGYRTRPLYGVRFVREGMSNAMGERAGQFPLICRVLSADGKTVLDPEFYIVDESFHDFGGELVVLEVGVLYPSTVGFVSGGYRFTIEWSERPTAYLLPPGQSFGRMLYDSTLRQGALNSGVLDFAPYRELYLIVDNSAGTVVRTLTEVHRLPYGVGAALKSQVIRAVGIGATEDGVVASGAITGGLVTFAVPRPPPLRGSYELAGAAAELARFLIFGR